MRHAALALLALAAGCGRSGVPLDEPGLWPLPHLHEESIPEPLVWHSWDAVVQDGPGPQATVADETGELVATIELYESGSNLSVQPGQAFDQFAAMHNDVASQDVGPVRWEDGSAYPYAGKNLTARTAADPSPPGVFDLQLHPPQNDRYVVAAFVVPVAGRYVVGDFAARHILADPGASWAGFTLGSDPDNVLSELLTPTADQLWDSQALGDVDLGDLPVNERICFGVYRGFIDGNNFGDATELSFTITASPPQ